MKFFYVEDKKSRRLVCVKFHLNRCRFAVAVAKCLGGSLFWDTVYCKRCWGVGFAKLQRGGGACDGIQCTRKAWNATKSQPAASATLTGPMSRRGSTMSPPISSTVNPTTRSPADSRGNRRLQREREFY